MDNKNIRTALEKQLKSANGPWERLPILIELTKDQYDPSHAYSCAVEALDTARRLNDSYWIACSIRQIAYHQLRLSRCSDAIDSLKQASTLFSQIGDARNRANTNLLLAFALITAGEFPEAMEILLELVPIFKNLADHSRLVKSYGYMGLIYQYIGDHSRGIKLHRKGISLAVKKGDLQEAGRLYAYLATSYRGLGDTASYRRYMFKSLAIQKKIGNLQGAAVAMANIANSYIEQKMFSQAEKYVRESGKIYRKLGLVANEASSWGRLGRIYEDKGDLGKAYLYHKRGIALGEKSEQAFITATLYESFGGFCITTGRSMRGIAYLKKAIALLDRTGDTFHKYRAYEMLAQAYEYIGNTAAALETYKQFTRIKESYINNQKFYEASQAEMKLRIKSLSKQLEKERTRTQDLTRKIEEKEASLTSLTLNLIKENQLRSKEAVSIKNSAEEGAEPDGNWEIFARQFHKIHHNFYGNIVRRFPTLTPTEIKVCSLIRIGLATKEIADLLCISKRTVDTHRVHIHKKLALPSGTSLARYIAGM